MQAQNKAQRKEKEKQQSLPFVNNNATHPPTIAYLNEISLQF